MYFKKFTYLFLFFIAANVVFAQADKIRIILHRPPPNQMDIGDMWNITLTNTTKEDLKIYLTGTATEEKDGLIVEGKSKVFTIKPGKTSYKYNDFTGAEIKYNNSKYKEIMLRLGNVPEGSYTICVTAYEESGDIAGQESCIIQPVKQMGSITLISPEDGGEITREQPILFSWTPLPGAKDYTLRIVEIKGDQSPEVAMKLNRTKWEKSGITTTTTQVSSKLDEDFQGDGDYDYLAWQVKSGEVESETFSLNIKKKNNNTEVSVSETWCGICKARHKTTYDCLFEDLKFVSSNIKVKIKSNKNVTSGKVYLINDQNIKVLEAQIIDNTFEFTDIKSGKYSLQFENVDLNSCLLFGNDSNCNPIDIQLISINNSTNNGENEQAGIIVITCSGGVGNVTEVDGNGNVTSHTDFDCSGSWTVVLTIASPGPFNDNFGNISESEKYISIINNINFHESRDGLKESFKKISKDETKYLQINPNSLKLDVRNNLLHNTCWCWDSEIQKYVKCNCSSQPGIYNKGK